MSIASKEAVTELQNKFLIEPALNLGCHHNALIGALKIFLFEDRFPQIWQVKRPETNESHAYLVYNQEVYNNGVTWPDTTYPDVDLETLQEQGSNITSRLIIGALKPLLGKEDDLKLLPILELITEGDSKSLQPLLIDAWCQVNNTNREEVLNGSF